MKSLVDHLAAEVVEDVGGIGAKLRQRERRVHEGALGGGRLDGSIVEGGKILVDAVDEAVAELAAFFAAEVKSHWVLASMTCTTECYWHD